MGSTLTTSVGAIDQSRTGGELQGLSMAARSPSLRLTLWQDVICLPT
jgi:hypothetical protein